jgi:hypothetical protein
LAWWKKEKFAEGKKVVEGRKVKNRRVGGRKVKEDGSERRLEDGSIYIYPPEERRNRTPTARNRGKEAIGRGQQQVSWEENHRIEKEKKS